MLQTTFFMFLGIFSISILISTTLNLIRFLSIQELNGPKDSPIMPLMLIDFGLLLLFMVQHSIMAIYRPTRKSAWKPIYRTFYTLATCIVLQVLMYCWQTVDLILWHIDTEDAPLTSLFFTLVHVFSWLILFLENTLTEPFYLIGIKQLYNQARGYKSHKRFFSKQFQELLEHMPHPGTMCFMLILWICPVMTLDRWLLATVLTIYMCKGYRVTNQDYLYTVTQIETAQYVTMTKSTEIVEQ